MADYTLEAETGHIRLSPVLFRLSARDYFKCYLGFPPGKFSVVPFFLCCRAIELALKALHLESKSQKEVKQLYSHDLEKSYRDLDAEQQTLKPEEKELLIAANEIYRDKQFEYLNVFDAGSSLRSVPRPGHAGCVGKETHSL